MRHIVITCNGNTVHDSVARGWSIESGSVTLGICSKIPEAEFTLNPQQYGWDYVAMNGDVVIKVDSRVIFSGRIKEIDTDKYGARTCYCEGDLARLRDVCFQEYDEWHSNLYEYIDEVIEKYETWSSDGVTFTVDFTGGMPTYTSTEGKISVLEALENALEGANDSETCYYWVEPTESKTKTIMVRQADTMETNAQVIQYGVNVKSIETELEAPEYTIVWPKVKDADGSYIDLSTAPDAWKDSTGTARNALYIASSLAKYGERHCYYTGSDLNAVGDNAITQLHSDVWAYMRENCEETQSISVKAVDLSVTDSKFEPFDITKFVTVISEMHGVNATTVIGSMEIDLTNETKDTVEVGAARTLISQM